MLNKYLQVFIFMICACKLNYVYAKRGIIQETETELKYVATCQHAEMVIKCTRDYVIHIIDAEETFTPATKCKNTIIKSQVCITAYEYASQKCNMQPFCKQTLPDKVIGSRCPTNNTYFIVIYQCLEYPEISVVNYVVCHNETKEINCGVGLISILDSFYGRKSRTTCARETAIKNFFDDPTAGEVMISRCNRRKTCTVNTTKEFGFVFENGGTQPETNYLEFRVRCYNSNCIFIKPNYFFN